VTIQFHRMDPWVTPNGQQGLTAFLSSDAFRYSQEMDFDLHAQSLALIGGKLSALTGEHPPTKHYQKLASKLLQARSNCERLQQDLTRLGIDRQKAFLDLSGDNLDAELARIEEAEGKLKGTIAQFQTALAGLERETAETRAAVVAQHQEIVGAAGLQAQREVEADRAAAVALLEEAIEEPLLHLLSLDRLLRQVTSGQAEATLIRQGLEQK
jgi:hypothetical protein